MIDGAGTDAIEADVIVFDEKTIADRVIEEISEVFAEGLKYVNVNGKVAIVGKEVCRGSDGTGAAENG